MVENTDKWKKKRKKKKEEKKKKEKKTQPNTIPPVQR